MGKKKRKKKQTYIDSLTEKEKFEKGMWVYLPLKSNPTKKVLCRNDGSILCRSGKWILSLYGSKLYHVRNSFIEENV